MANTILKPGISIAGRYFVAKSLRSGGMSYLWLARTIDGNYVVIKEPKLDENANINIEKIAYEARVLRNINHNNIVKYVDSYRVTKLPDYVVPPRNLSTNPVILVLEFINGSNLEAFRRNVELSNNEIIDFMRQLCSAVSYIHKRNIIHRDLKPSNVLLKDGKLVKVIDFGTSRYYFDQALANEVVISPGGYTAPEQYKGVSIPQSDIWSLGAILYFLVTGREPALDMPGYPNDIRYIPDPTRYRTDISETIVRVIRRSLHPNPSFRYSTVDSMLSDLLNQYLPSTQAELEAVQLVIRGEIYSVSNDVIIIGRGEDPDKPVDIEQSGDRAYVKIYDPGMYISRNHCMIFRKGSKWFIKDLGSLNKTAIYRQDQGWIIVHKAYKEESPEFELRDGDIISVVYDEKKGPYLQISIRLPEKNP